VVVAGSSIIQKFLERQIEVLQGFKKLIGYKIALKLLHINMPVDKIAEITGLSEKETDKIKE
jgi:hypothetical protein